MLKIIARIPKFFATLLIMLELYNYFDLTKFLELAKFLNIS